MTEKAKLEGMISKSRDFLCQSFPIAQNDKSFILKTLDKLTVLTTNQKQDISNRIKETLNRPKMKQDHHDLKESIAEFKVEVKELCNNVIDECYPVSKSMANRLIDKYGLEEYDQREV